MMKTVFCLCMLIAVSVHGAQIVVSCDGRAKTNLLAVANGVLHVSARQLGPADWVEITPDFAHAEKGEAGYFVLPSGHLGTFREDEGTFSVPTDLMPLWGMKTPRGTWCVLVEGLPWDCQLVVRAQRGDYTVSMRFDLGGRPADEDLAVRLHELAPDEDYPQMAAWYRNLRLSRGEIVPLVKRMAENPELAYAAKAVEVRIRQAWKPAPPPVKEQTPSNEPPMKVAVTFDRVSEFAHALKTAGVERAEICLVGWNRKGHDGRYPQLFPVEPELGGEAGLRKLIADVQGLGYRIVCHNNHSDAYTIADCWASDDVIRNPDGSLSKNACWSGGQMYNLCPKVAWEKYAQGDLSKIADLGFRGLHYIDVLSIVAPRRCFDRRHPLTRRESAAYVNCMLRRSADLMGGSASEGGYDFAAGNLDYALYVSFADPTASMTKLTDRFVPFWQLVYHGIVMSNPFAHTTNYTIKDKRTQLVATEFGARPAFYVHSKFLEGRAWMGQDDLELDTPEHFAAAVAAVKRGADEYARRSDLQTSFMNDHRVRSDGKVEIRYSDGTCLTVGDSEWQRSSTKWLYPQMSMELYRVHEMRDNARRMGMYAAHPGKLPALANNAEFRRRCAEDAPLPEMWGHVISTRYDKSDGTRYVTVGNGFCGGGTIRSAESGWEARTFDGTWHPVAAYPDAPVPPHRERLPENRAFSAVVETNGWYDAGEERLAYVECAAATEPHLFVGESVPEMMCEDKVLMEYDPTMTCVADGRWRTQLPLAFRYLRFKEPVTDVKVVPVGRNRSVVGRIVTDNPRWSKMFDVGVRTLSLCSDDFLIDGIKRDRLPWAGDLTVSLMADAYVYGDAEVARRSLSVMDAYEGDVNGIVTYSMWTIISHDLYQLYFGDRPFLTDRWWRIKQRIDDLVSRTDADGFVAKGLDWVFIDWAKPQSETALHMVWYGALLAAARLADRVGDARAADYRALAAKVRASLDRRAWDEKRGLYCANPDDRTVFGRQANVYAVVFGVADGACAKGIGDELAADRLPSVGTPYVYGWELVALNRTGHHQAFFEGLERVFGAMLDAGATTFWEGYDASEKGNARYAFYGRPWAKSLCHVWSAWPAFIFASEVLGIKPTSDGWKTWERKPIPGAEGLRATIPTPAGVLSL